MGFPGTAPDTQAGALRFSGAAAERLGTPHDVVHTLGESPPPDKRPRRPSPFLATPNHNDSPEPPSVCASMAPSVARNGGGVWRCRPSVTAPPRFPLPVMRGLRLADGPRPPGTALANLSCTLWVEVSGSVSEFEPSPLRSPESSVAVPRRGHLQAAHPHPGLPLRDGRTRWN